MLSQLPGALDRAALTRTPAQTQIVVSASGPKGMKSPSPSAGAAGSEPCPVPHLSSHDGVANAREDFNKQRE